LGGGEVTGGRGRGKSGKKDLVPFITYVSCRRASRRERNKEQVRILTVFQVRARGGGGAAGHPPIR